MKLMKLMKHMKKSYGGLFGQETLVTKTKPNKAFLHELHWLDALHVVRHGRLTGHVTGQ